MLSTVPEHINALSTSVLWIIIFAFSVYNFKGDALSKWVIRILFALFCSGVVYEFMVIIAILWRGN